MAVMLPFYNLSDSELLSVFGSSEKLGFERYSDLVFDTLEYNEEFDQNLNWLYSNAVSYGASDYYELSDFFELARKNKPKKNCLLTLFMNIRSISKNLNEFLEDYVHSDIKYDFISFCETRLVENIGSIFNLHGFNMVTKNYGGGGGGVVIYINKKYSFNAIAEISVTENFFESIFVKVSIHKSNFIVGCIYRSPGSDVQSFIDKFSAVLQLNCN